MILVSDTSVLIDLERGGLLDAAFTLPHEFAVPDVLYDREMRGEWGPFEKSIVRRLAAAFATLQNRDAFETAAIHPRHGRAARPYTPASQARTCSARPF